MSYPEKIFRTEKIDKREKDYRKVTRQEEKSRDIKIIATLSHFRIS